MKRLVFLSIIIIVFAFVYIQVNSDKDQGQSNLENIKKIEIGMDTTAVLKIMGQPIEKRFFQGEMFYDYEMPEDISLQGQIIFDSTKIVKYVSPDFTKIKK